MFTLCHDFGTTNWCVYTLISPWNVDMKRENTMNDVTKMNDYQLLLMSNQWKTVKKLDL